MASTAPQPDLFHSLVPRSERDRLAVERWLMRSGYLDEGWYLQTYPAVAATGLSPVQHYLRIGAALGHDPSTGFETRHYCDSVPGLAGSGVNPLLHYLMVGRAAGRVPHSRPVLRRIRALEAALWGGCADQAEPELQAIALDAGTTPALRAEAALRLAPWREYCGDAEGATALLQGIAAAAPPAMPPAQWVIPLAWLLMVDGHHGGAVSLLDQLPALHPDAVLLRAALAPPGADRLAVINRLYVAAGLAGLSLRDPLAPLHLGNLATGPVHPGLPDIGKVSVIMPVHAAEAHLAAAVAGVQAQSYRNLELIIVDDCSPDGTHALALRLAAADSRIIVLRTPRNGGAYAARNLGLARASGDFVTTHDADDWSHPQKLEQQLAPLARDPALQASVCHWARCRRDLTVTTNWRLSAQVLHWSHSSLLFRRAVADRLGGWDPVRAGADAEYIWRIEAVFGAQTLVKVLPRVPLAWALDDAGSLTRARDTHIRTNFHGLRHVYREICRYWLQKPAELLADGGQAKRAMFPPELTRRGGAMPRDLDLHLLGNLADAGVTGQIAALLAGAAPGSRIGVTHQPTPAVIGPFQPDVMRLAEQRALDLLLPGTPVRAARVITLHPAATEPGGAACD